jgi:hypothetical protein
MEGPLTLGHFEEQRWERGLVIHAGSPSYLEFETEELHEPGQQSKTPS